MFWLPRWLPKPGLHAPDREQRPRRHAVALLDRSKHRALRLLQRAAARDDGRRAPLGEKLIERQLKAALAAVGIDGRLRVVRRHQGRDGRGADALGPRFAGELLLPGFKTGGGAAALGGVGLGVKQASMARVRRMAVASCLLLAMMKKLPRLQSLAAKPPHLELARRRPRSPGVANRARRQNRSARSAHHPQEIRARRKPDLAGVRHRAALADDRREVVLSGHAIAERRAQAMPTETFDLCHLNHRRDPQF